MGMDEKPAAIVAGLALAVTLASGWTPFWHWDPDPVPKSKLSTNTAES